MNFIIKTDDVSILPNCILCPYFSLTSEKVSDSCPQYSRRIMETPLKDMKYSLLCLIVLYAIINKYIYKINIYILKLIKKSNMKFYCMLRERIKVLRKKGKQYFIVFHDMYVISNID